MRKHNRTRRRPVIEGLEDRKLLAASVHAGHMMAAMEMDTPRVAAAAVARNRPPLRPTINEPSRDGQLVAPDDVHMETSPMRDLDPRDVHTASDFEIWTAAFPRQPAWVARQIGGLEKVHAHLGDGRFVGNYAGRRALLPNTNYILRVRHYDSKGVPGAWVVRPFRTTPVYTPAASPGPVYHGWQVMQPGFVVEEVAGGFQLPVNITFNPNPGPNPGDPLFYVAELYGTIKVVTRDGTVKTYADNLLNFNPTGNFPGSGEQGLAGLVVDPKTGDLFGSLLYDDGTGNHHPKIVRFHSEDGGLTAATQTTIWAAPREVQGQSHQISNLSIGPDGRLYVHVGDGMVPSASRNKNFYRGKILRMNFDGTPAVGNPFLNPRDGINAKDYIFASGFRNPFGGAWRARDGKLYEVENGPSVDRLARVDRGADYGYTGKDANMRIRAIYNWHPATAPVNLAFVQRQTFGGSGFPGSKQDRLYVTLSGSTWATGPQPGGKRIVEFQLDARGRLMRAPVDLIRYAGTGKATAVALAAGPDGLYYSELYADQSFDNPIAAGARVLRVRYVGA
jgi:glucose/arabinose dehydrogenase